MMVLGAILLAAAQLVLAGSMERGREIYVRGAGAGGAEILASMGGAADLPASLLPCINCHGHDGRGIPEGGVVPPNVRWSELTKPYPIAAANGRLRPPYDERSFARCMREGEDPMQNPLGGAMPRYRMSDQEIADLIAYLRVLGTGMARGVDADEVRIGVIAPSEGPSMATSALERVLQAYFAERSAIAGRRVVVETLTAGGDWADGREEELPFALVAVSAGAGQEALLELAASRGIPLLAATAPAALERDESRSLFFVFSGGEEQARALLEFASSRDPDSGGRVALLSEKISMERQITEAGMRLAPGPEEGDPPENVLIDGGTDVTELLRRLERQRSSTWVLLMPGTLPAVLPQIPAGFRGKVVAALPFLPTQDEGPRAPFGDFMRSLGSEARTDAAHRYAYAVARILEKALVDSGRDLDSETFIASLEKLYRFDTGGAVPPVTFNRFDHIGVDPVIVEIDGGGIVKAAQSSRAADPQKPVDPRQSQ